MQDFEKLGLFYLGRQHSLTSGKTLDQPVLYDSRDLVTHAVVVGMTGSGKTGLCLALIEEAAIDGVPAIAIDPKGDLGNLLLTFPSLAPEDFRPWIDEEEARRDGETPDAFAANEARRWKEGLSDWGEDGARIERLRRAAEFAIYTPGSRAGLPVSILQSFAAPPAAAREDAEMMADRARSTATSVLVLAGIDAPPRSREHTLLSTLFGAAWREGRDLDLAALIQQVQMPSVRKFGVVEMESFFPSKERFDFAMRLNGLLAAPGFDQWLEGAPLDPATLLYTAEGRPRVAIFSIAHLGDAERMFFVSLLLNQMVAWMRAQDGTSSLRAILYMDEILGYFPPVANPPSKEPFLTLLKQGRAFGLGVLLATQNPVDLDYKGLANAGTWFLGRLQTERDKARLLDGLEGAASGALNRADADRTLSILPKRVFLLHNVHESAPVVFQTRWTLSYLRGPLTREQIKSLTSTRQVAAEAAKTQRSAPSVTPRVTATAVNVDTDRLTADPPIVPPGIEQFFVPRAADGGPAGGREATISYVPAVIAAGRVTFADAKLGINETRDVLYAASISEGAVAVDWTIAARLGVAASELRRDPERKASFAPLPAAALQPRNYVVWQKDFIRWLAQTARIEILRNRELGLTARAGEAERDFAIRVQNARRAARDEAVETVRRKYAAREAQLNERLRRAEATVGREEAQASQQKLQTAVSVGATMLGALFGRKVASVGTLGRATTAARGLGRSVKEAGDVKRATENADVVRGQLQALENEIRQETQRITADFDTNVPLERVPLAPKRGQVEVQFVALGWLPSDSPYTGR